MKKKEKNPTTRMLVLGLQVEVEKLKTDVSWLKKGYWIQGLIGIGTFIAVLGLLFRIMGVI